VLTELKKGMAKKAFRTANLTFISLGSVYSLQIKFGLDPKSSAHLQLWSRYHQIFVVTKTK